jgi:hypothetical protein
MRYDYAIDPLKVSFVIESRPIKSRCRERKYETVNDLVLIQLHNARGRIFNAPKHLFLTMREGHHTSQ